MKTKCFIILLIFLCSMLSSCSSNHDENVIFIHGVLFGRSAEEQMYDITFICENLDTETEKGNYYCFSFECDDLKTIPENLEHGGNKYYFATTELYIFDESLSENSLFELALFLCDSNKFPISSYALQLYGADSKSFCEKVKSKEDFEKMLSLSKNQGKRLCDFFKEISQEKNGSLALSQNEEK